MAARRLDRTKPFGTVHGLIGAVYEQNGVLFDASCNEVGAGQLTDAATGDAAPTPVVPLAPEPVADAPAPAHAPPVAESPPVASGPKTPDEMTDDELRTAMASLGGFFTTRPEALQFLRGKI